ncbi:DNA mismatch endonuclease Vsr [Mesorhizobium kowhaii]
MASIRKVDTKPELVVRRRAHALGFRFRLHRRDLPGTPDLVFPGRKKAIFVHGCFWHQHGCGRGQKLPSVRAEYWGPKLRRNVERDAAAEAALLLLGWQLLVVWECECQDSTGLSERLRRFLVNT